LRSWYRWIAVLTFAGIVGLCAGVIGVGLKLSSPVQTTIGAPPTDLKAEGIEFQSASGATIRGWFIAGQPGRGAVVLMHGVHANRLSMVRRARLLAAQGFAVLLFDFQAHGESAGARITFGHLEGRDVAAAVAFMRQRTPGERIGVIGSSLGGAAALLAPGGLHVDAIVLESVYPDIGSATANRINAVLGAPLGPLVSKPVALLFELLMAPILGTAPADLRPIDRMADINTPVLVIGGTSDTSTTPEETTAMFERARPPKYIWLIQGAGHVDAEQYGLEAYHARVFGFLSERLRRQ
jgi:alpha-beta hydrolase superfamily lysophospholipase